jgi:hypothetical protein
MRNNSNNIDNAILAFTEWGKIKLLKPTLESYLKDIKSDYNSSITKCGKDIKEVINTAVEETKQKVEEAKKLLSSREFITSIEGDEIWYEAKEALTAFDRVNFLNKAIAELIEDPIKKDALKQLDNIMMNTLSWFDDSNWSPLRLTILNNYRKEILEKIPEEQRYLFPWYEVFVEYDEDIIEVLIQNYDCLLGKEKDERVPQILQDNLREILFEITKDDELLSTIKERYVLHKKILEVYSQRNSLTLWRLSEKAALDYPVTGEVAKIGLVRLSTRLIQTTLQKISSRAEKIYWMFLSAFCGPDLDDKQRLQLLDIVEKKIININVQNINGEIVKILSPLKQWFEGRDNDNWLASSAYTTWNKMLQEEAKKVEIREFETDEKVEHFWQAIESLKNKWTWIENLKEFIPKLQPSPVLRYVPVETRDEEREESEKTFEKNTLEITACPDNQGNYPILPQPGLVCSGDINLYNYEVYSLIATSERIYCGGVLIKEEEKEILYTVELSATKKQFYLIKEEGYQKAIIGLSDDRNLVEQFVSIMSSEEPDLQNIKDKTLNLILIIISF